MPLHARWVIGDMPWDWDFSRTRQELRPPSAADFCYGDAEPEWLELYLFGFQDFWEGGASPYIGVHKESGAVYGLDVERETECVFFLNSSVLCFIETFLIFNQVFGEGAASPEGLRAKVRAADPEGFDRSGWREAVDEVEREIQ